MSTSTVKRSSQHPRWKVGVTLAAVLPLFLAACGSNNNSSGSSADEAWKPTKDVEFIVPYSAGGGYDAYARGIAQVMKEEKALPDGVNVVVRNVEPTAQGITQMYTAEPDGQTLGILPMPAAYAQEVLTPEVARWDTKKFSVLGAVDANAYVIYVPSDSPYQTIEDLQAASGLKSLTVEKGSTSSLAADAAITGLGLDAELVYGAEGSSEVVAAALRGDADFFVYGASDVVGFVDSGDIRPILFLGTEDQRSSELAWLQDVPNAEDAGVPDLAGTVTELRALVAPPGLPAPVFEYWSTTLNDLMTSDAFIQWAAKAQRPLVVRSADQAKGDVQDQISHMAELLPKLSL